MSPGSERAVQDTVALVLAGGRGERLQALTENQAKPGLTFGGKFRLIDFPLSNSMNSGIRRVAVITQYCAHELLHHVQRTWGSLRHEFGEFVEVWPAQQRSRQSSWYDGTADAVYQNIERLGGLKPKYILILAGDHVYKQDYAALVADHIAHDADVTISCVSVPLTDANRFGVVRTSERGGVTQFLEKPRAVQCTDNSGTCLASMGIYVFNFDILRAALVRDAKDPNSEHDFGRNILPSLVAHGRVFAHEFSKSAIDRRSVPYWRDVGTVDAYWRANMDLLNADQPFDLYDRSWPIWTAPDHEPPVRIADSDSGPSMVLSSILAPGCVVSGGTVLQSLLCTDTQVGARARICESIALPGCRIGTGAHVTRTILAENCRIPPGLVVGENEHDDSRRFYRSSEGIVLVTPEMLDRLGSPLIVSTRLPRPMVHSRTMRKVGMPVAQLPTMIAERPLSSAAE